MASRTDSKLIRFPCQCGVFLTARAALAGRKGKCGKCGHINVIPSPDEVEQFDSPPQDAVAIQEICSVCQSPIEADDQRTMCSECDLPFHAECWEENLGCSAYGCRNVNALKLGPDIRIEQSALAGPPGYVQPMPRPMPRPTKREEDEFPTAFLLLGASGIAALLSVVMCGLPSVMVGLLAIVYAVAKKGRVRMDATIACCVLAGLGALGGLYLSLIFWLV